MLQRGIISFSLQTNSTLSLKEIFKSIQRPLEPEYVGQGRRELKLRSNRAKVSVRNEKFEINLKWIWVNGLSSILFEVFSVSAAQYKSFFIEENKLKGNINYENIFWCTTWLFSFTWEEEKRRGLIVLVHGKQQQIWKAVLQHSFLFINSLIF